MWKVFQRFVMNFFRMRQDVYKVQALEFDWHDSQPFHSEALSLPGLATDVVLSNEMRRIVIETKYFTKPFLNWHEKTMLRPPHESVVRVHAKSRSR
jgi:5-methylcytosine-specific restriction enzyme subunit McrC